MLGAILDAVKRRIVIVKYAKFLTNVDDFAERDSISDMAELDPKFW